MAVQKPASKTRLANVPSTLMGDTRSRSWAMSWLASCQAASQKVTAASLYHLLLDIKIISGQFTAYRLGIGFKQYLQVSSDQELHLLAIQIDDVAAGDCLGGH